jgi:hypothetical protein
MFCLECGAEMATRARVCPVCGHVYGDRERSLVESASGQAGRGSVTFAPPAANTFPGGAAHPSGSVVHVGDRSPAGLPHDLPGRVVLAVSLGMAADLILPWISVNNVNVTPANIGAPVVVVVALLAMAVLPVFTQSLRQHPVWSALPLIVGAFCSGIGGCLWLLLAPLTQIFAASFGSDPSNLSLSPQAGLYLFLIGSAILLISGQRMLAATNEALLGDARRDAIRSVQARSSAPPRTAASGATSHVIAREPLAPVATSAAVAYATDGHADPAAASAEAAQQQPSIPAAPQAPAGPVLPGSDAWHQAPAAPAPLRPAPGGGWGKSRNLPRPR